MNKIGWCTMTWNPVWGCLNKCPYCYARAIAKRFKRKMAKLEYKNYVCDVGEDGYDVMRWIDNLEERLKFFRPTFLHSQFNKKLPVKPQRIFVGSMSEIEFWREDWVKKVIEKTKEYPQHIFQFLTKHPTVYKRYVFPRNCWLGVTITRDIELCDVSFLQFAYRDSNNIKYISFEPLLNRIVGLSVLNYFDWIIVGTETGNRKGRPVFKEEWFWDIKAYCDDAKIPLYAKDNLFCRPGYVNFVPDLWHLKKFPKPKK